MLQHHPCRYNVSLKDPSWQNNGSKTPKGPDVKLRIEKMFLKLEHVRPNTRKLEELIPRGNPWPPEHFAFLCIADKKMALLKLIHLKNLNPSLPQNEGLSSSLQQWQKRPQKTLQLLEWTATNHSTQYEYNILSWRLFVNYGASQALHTIPFHSMQRLWFCGLWKNENHTNLRQH